MVSEKGGDDSRSCILIGKICARLRSSVSGVTAKSGRTGITVAAFLSAAAAASSAAFFLAASAACVLETAAAKLRRCGMGEQN
jgi:hypothetical protein